MRQSYFAIAITAIAISTGACAQTTYQAPKIIDRISIPDGGWDYAYRDNDRNRLYVARSNGVMALAGEPAVVTATFAPGERVHGVITLPGTNLAVSTNAETNSAKFFDADNGAVIASVPTGQNPDALVYEPRSGLVAVMNGKSQDVTLIDPKTQTAIGTIAVGGKLEFSVANGTGLVFVNIEDRSEIAVVDIAARKVTNRFKLANCEEPTGIDRDGAFGVLITACGGGSALVVDETSGKVVAHFPIGKGADAVIFDPSRHLAFIPSGSAGTLATIRIDGKNAASLLGTVPTQTSARTGAMDFNSGRLYLMAARYAAAKEGERPKPVPGSFELLVLSTK